MVGKTLVLYDGSIETKKVLKIGLQLAKVFNAECHVLRVAAPTDPINSAEGKYDFDEGFLGAKFIANQEGVNIQTHIMTGDTRKVLRYFARTEQVDLIVVAQEKKKYLSGSISDYLLRATKVSVLSVK